MRKTVFKILLHTHNFFALEIKTPLKVLKYTLVLSVFISAGIIFRPFFCVEVKAANPDIVIRGIIHDEAGTIAGAIVRIQTTEYSTETDSNGRFRLPVPENLNGPVKLTAWAKGYFIGGPAETSPGAEDVSILLHRHARWDNPEYELLPSFQSEGTGENQGCSECHFRGKTTGPALPVDEWIEDAHSQSATNPLFLTLHAGKDVSGRRSQSTRYKFSKDFKLIALAPDPEKPYYGPGFMLDNPNFAGNCGACHLPVAAINAPLNTYPEAVQGIKAEGINCDFCHKIWDVHLDPDTGLPPPDKPGVLSYEYRRPFDGHQFFAGPLDDIAPGEDTYSSIQKTSQFCAPCHFGVFENTVIYNSFGEWLRSPYSRAEEGKTCQDCHMPSSGAEYFTHPEKDGLKRDSTTIVSHKMPGTRGIDLLQNAVSLTLEAEQAPEGIRVRTKVSNDYTGHHVPTDSPLRHMILIVRAYGSDNSELPLKNGAVLPEWCGSGDPTEGCYAGLPGKVFIKLLEDKWTGISPAAAYWRPTNIVMDTRLGAFESDVGDFLFANPLSGDVRVEADLVYRRAYKKLLEQKGIDEPDIIMESARILLSQKP